MKQIKEGDLRYYVSGSDKYISVTSLLGLLDNFDRGVWLKILSKQNPTLDAEAVESLANSITKEFASLGTKIHHQIEKYFLNGQKLDLEKQSLADLITNYIKPYKEGDDLHIEKQILYAKGDIKFAGTYDLCCFFPKPFIDWKTGENVSTGKVILDWKNTRKVKYPKAYSHWDKSYYYPLTKYFLQLSAYVAGYNVTQTEDKNKINETVVIVNPKGVQKTYVYYCNPKKTLFYWEVFQEMFNCYLTQKEFNWDDLNSEIKLNNVEPSRLLVNAK
jgi:hypothetical protein